MKPIIVFILLTLNLNLVAKDITEPQPIYSFQSSCKPKTYQAYVNWASGYNYINSGFIHRAFYKFLTASQIDSTYCDAYSMMAYCFLFDSELDSSIKYANKSIELNPNNSNAYIIKGYTLLKLKDTVESFKIFEKVMNHSKSLVDGYYGVALIYYYRSEKSESIKIIDEYISKYEEETEIKNLNKLRKLRKICVRS